MPRRKVVHKGDALKGTPYLVYNPHLHLNITQTAIPSLSKEELNPFTQKLDHYLQIVSIDPGIKNCGFFIGRIWNSGHHECKFLSRINFCDSTGRTGSTSSATNLSSETSYYNNIFVKLNPLSYLFDNTHYVVIEKQMSVNIKLIKFTHYLICYFMMSLSGKGYLPLIFEIDSHLKTKMLGAPSFKQKPQRKAWCRNFVLTIFEKSDSALFEFVSKLGKNDDVSDAICQEMAFSIVSGIVNPFERVSNQSKIPSEHYFLLSTPPGPRNIYGKIVHEQKTSISQPKIGKRTHLVNSSQEFSSIINDKLTLDTVVKISSIKTTGLLLPTICSIPLNKAACSEEKNKKNSLEKKIDQ